jgi:hypothetical protein
LLSFDLLLHSQHLLIHLDQSAPSLPVVDYSASTDSRARLELSGVDPQNPRPEQCLFAGASDLLLFQKLAIAPNPAAFAPTPRQIAAIPAGAIAAIHLDWPLLELSQ